VKKIILAMVLILSVMVVMACASKPITTQQETDDALKKVYQKYKNDLIIDGAEPYTVVSGDTLSRISREKYNNGFYFPLIMLASSEIVLDPDRIDPDMVLTVPDLQVNLDDAKARGRIKSFLGDIAKIEDRRNRPADAQGLRDLAASL